MTLDYFSACGLTVAASEELKALFGEVYNSETIRMVKIVINNGLVAVLDLPHIVAETLVSGGTSNASGDWEADIHAHTLFS